MNSVLIVATGFVVLFAAGQFVVTRRRRTIKRARAGQTFHTFIDDFADEHINEAVLRAVYNRLQYSVADNTFPVRGSDLLHETYGLADEDYCDLINDLIAQVRTTRPSAQLVERITTVADLVRMLAA